MTLRNELWNVAMDQYGYVTTRDADALGAPAIELVKLAARGGLRRISQGVYRFSTWPAGARDHLMEAVLWTRDAHAALSHDTALDVYDLSDINPDVIHVTIPRRTNKLRRRDTPPGYVIHYEDLAPEQISWWEEIPTVSVPTAIDQGIASHVRPDLLRQSIDTARARGLIDPATAGRQRAALPGRNV
jgi:predicted transcriptional regulator of viral defense system